MTQAHRPLWRVGVTIHAYPKRQVSVGLRRYPQAYLLGGLARCRCVEAQPRVRPSLSAIVRVRDSALRLTSFK
jgi:hypothetical protein